MPSRLPVKLLVLALAAGAAVPSAWAQVRVLAVQGQASVDGRPLVAGATLASGRLATGSDASLQLRLADGTLLWLPQASEVQLAAGGDRRLILASGGLRLATQADDWRIDLGERSIRSVGYLKLQWCGAGCTASPGLYGSVAQGEAVLEYQGGRSVLRGRHFHWAGASERPEVLVLQPALLVDAGNRDSATRARSESAALLKSGIEAFGAGQDAAARQALEQVREAAPSETLVPYYLGLIALRQGDNGSALRLLQQFAIEDPDGAAAREVPKTLTLLTSSQLQQEVQATVAREREVTSAEPPDTGSIAVQAFVNRGDDSFRAMAKGLAAMIIADLSKVPGLKVLEREKMQLLLDEMKLGDSGIADPASAARSGRLMRAEKVIVGNFEVQ